MRKVKSSVPIWFIILAVAFAIYAVWFNQQEPEISYDYRVPPAPPERYPDKYWLWDSYKHEWVLRNLPNTEFTSVVHRANTSIDPELDEDALQEYLEEHIDGYIEETYWGEEWEFNDLK